MKVQIVSKTGVGSSDAIVVNTNTNPCNIGFGVLVTGTVDYTVQHTFDDPATGFSTWFSHPTIASQAANADGNYAALIPKWIDALINKKEITVYGDGQQKRDFTFVDDVTNVFANSISNLIKAPKPINLAFGNPVTINTIIEILRRQFGLFEINYAEPRHGDIRDSEADPSFLKSLGLMTFTPTVLEDGLLKTIEWYLGKRG